MKATTFCDGVSDEQPEKQEFESSDSRKEKNLDYPAKTLWQLRYGNQDHKDNYARERERPAAGSTDVDYKLISARPGGKAQ